MPVECACVRVCVLAVSDSSEVCLFVSFPLCFCAPLLFALCACVCEDHRFLGEMSDNAHYLTQ